MYLRTFGCSAGTKINFIARDVEDLLIHDSMSFTGGSGSVYVRASEYTLAVDVDGEG